MQSKNLQFLGPALNGMYANGFRPCEFSGKKLSGLNFSGFGNTFGSRCSTYDEMRHVVPAGIVYSPIFEMKQKFRKIENCVRKLQPAIRHKN